MSDFINTMNKQLIIGITGYPGVGKTTFSNLLCNELSKSRLSCCIYRISDFIKEEMEQKKTSLERKNIYLYSLQVKKTYGADIWIRKIIQRINDKQQKCDIVIIDGIRTESELKTFKQNKNLFLLCGIVTADNLIVKRIRERNRIDDKWIFSNNNSIFADESKMGVNYCIDCADFLIINNGYKSSLKLKAKYFISNYILPKIEKYI